MKTLAVLLTVASPVALGFQHHATLFPRVAPSRVARDDKMWVGDLINMVRGTDLGSDVTESKRVMVNELLVKLERTNPTQSPVGYYIRTPVSATPSMAMHSGHRSPPRALILHGAGHVAAA